MADQSFNVNCGFFNSVNNDRLYSADDMNKPYHRLVSDGVFADNVLSNDLQVYSAGDGMKIRVNKGEGIFGSKWFENPEIINIIVPNNSDTYPRKDSVIVQVDTRLSSRAGKIVYRTGTAALNPQPPEIGNITNVIEYRIANIYVEPNTTEIGQELIEDLRGSSECPWVAGLIQQVDTSTLYEQWNTAYQNYYNNETARFNNFLSNLTEDLAVNTNLIRLEHSFITVSNDTSSINISNLQYNPSVDMLNIYINGLKVSSNRYTISNDAQTVTFSPSLVSNQTVMFEIIRSVINVDDTTVLDTLTTVTQQLVAITNDSDWNNLTLINGATAYSSELTPAIRLYNNQVFVRGCIKGITANNTIFATIPEEFAPAMTRYYTVASGSITVTIEISTTGELKIVNIIGTVNSNSLIPIDTNFILG